MTRAVPGERITVVIGEWAIAESAQFQVRRLSHNSTIAIRGEQTVTEKEPALIDQIGGLTSEQAQQAVLNLYDELPDELWLNQSKWDLEDFPVRAEQLEFSSPASLRPALQEVIGPGNDALKGELAKAVLAELASLDDGGGDDRLDGHAPAVRGAPARTRFPGP
jgi:hypothetical protein